MNINYNGAKLQIGEKEIFFPETICQVKYDEKNVYILLDIPEKKEFCYDDFHNIYGYSLDGEKIWQIGIRPKGDDIVYTMIGIDDTFLYANDFVGRRYSVDKNTGEINGMRIVK